MEETKMTARQYLGQAYRLDQRINSKLMQLSLLRGNAINITANLSEITVQTSHDNTKMENTILKIMQQEREIDDEIDRLVDLKAEKERKRSNHKDELGVRIQNLGNYSNPTADEAVLDVMLEGAINGLNSAEDALSDPALVQEFKRREYVIVMMADEYASFKRHLHALSVKEQELIIPLLKQEKDYYTLAEEAGVSVPVVRRKASRIHCELISYMENYFIEKL